VLQPAVIRFRREALDQPGWTRRGGHRLRTASTAISAPICARSFLPQYHQGQVTVARMVQRCLTRIGIAISNARWWRLPDRWEKTASWRKRACVARRP